MKVPTVFTKLRKEHKAFAKSRREVIGKSNDALNLSKRAIFALHRDDSKTSDRLIEDAKQRFVDCERLTRNHKALVHEGAYRAALEEYAEALLYRQYLHTGTFGTIDARAMGVDIYIAGLSDATGEIVRHVQHCVTQGDISAIQSARVQVEMVITYLLSLDLTGYLRTKFDQAKKNLRRLEEMSYDVSIRNRT
jgi:predicted translin family RNA/ssDNA-binding protein